MILACRAYLKQKQIASLQQIANHLRCQRSALQPVLDILQRKGMCRALLPAEADITPIASRQAGVESTLNTSANTTTHKRCGNCQCSSGSNRGPNSRTSGDINTDIQLNPGSLYQWVR